jgi:hypothetical protein
VDRGERVPAVEIAGAVDGRHFAVSALERRVSLDVIETASDADGPYALIAPFERVWVGQFLLRLQPDFDEDGSTSAELEIVIPGDRSGPEAALRRQGVDPSNHNLLVAAKFSVSVYFDSDGFANGYGASGSTSSKPPRSN